MNVGEFKALVSTALNRGTSLDARIPGMVQLAVQWFERNYTFKYMERFKLLQVKANDRTILMPNNITVKGMKFLRFVDDTGQYAYVKKIEPEDSAGVGTSTETGKVPGKYWIVGNTTLVFAAVPPEDLNGEAMWYEFTDFPKDQNDAKHFLIDTAADALLAQTLLNMSAFATRDARMAQAYKIMRDEALNTLTRSEDETKFAGEVIEMEYRPV